MLLPDVAGEPAVALIAVPRCDSLERVDAPLCRPEPFVRCDVRQPGREHVASSERVHHRAHLELDGGAKMMRNRSAVSKACLTSASAATQLVSAVTDVRALVIGEGRECGKAVPPRSRTARARVRPHAAALAASLSKIASEISSKVSASR